MRSKMPGRGSWAACVLLVLTGPGSLAEARCSTGRPARSPGQRTARANRPGQLVRLTRYTERLRPTPSAPRMSLGELGRLGIEVYKAAGKGPKASPTKRPHFVFVPGKRFDAAAAKKKGLVAIRPGRSGQPYLKYLQRLPAGSSGQRIDARLYPRRPRTLARSFAPPARGRRIRVAFFDADSTLRVTRSGAPSADTPGDMVLLPMVGPRMTRLARQGYLIAIVSNQGGIEKGYITDAVARGGLLTLCRTLSRLGVPVHYYDYAPRFDGFRKPGTGMGDRLARVVRRDLGREIDWRGSFMVGDSGWKRQVDREPGGRAGEDYSNSDRRFAENLRGKYAARGGMKFFHPRGFFGWTKRGVRNFENVDQVREFVARHPDLDPGVNRFR